jgi:hypothetical protein
MLQNKEVFIFDPLPVRMHLVDVIIDGLFVFKHLLTGWTVVLCINMQISHVPLDIA